MLAVAERLAWWALRNIICVTDLSPDSLAATAYSLSLARDHQAKLTILYTPGCVIAEDWDGRISLMESFSIRGTEKRFKTGSQMSSILRRCAF